MTKSHEALKNRATSRIVDFNTKARCASLSTSRKKRIEAMRMHVELAYTQAVLLEVEAKREDEKFPNEYLRNQVDLLDKASSALYDAAFAMEVLHTCPLDEIGQDEAPY